MQPYVQRHLGEAQSTVWDSKELPSGGTRFGPRKQQLAREDQGERLAEVRIRFNGPASSYSSHRAIALFPGNDLTNPAFSLDVSALGTVWAPSIPKKAFSV